MSWSWSSRCRVTLLTVLLAVVGFGSGTSLTTVVQASTAPRAPQAAFGPPKEGAKVVLADTSIDGPAIMTTYTPATVLAWTGTDAAHHLNVMTSNDGLHYSHKHILPETSLWRPALAFIDSGRGKPYGTIVLAWTGTDSNHTLNVEFIKMPDFTVTRKLTFWGENSFTSPAITTINGDVNSDVYLSWAGTDLAHTLNIVHFSSISQMRDKHTLWGWNSISRPNLDVDRSSSSSILLVLSWTGINHHISFANGAYSAPAASKVTWSMPSTSPLSVQSAWAPSMISFNMSGWPTTWLAWTGSGTTATKNLHVQYTQHYPAWSDPNASVTLGETAISSPALTYSVTGTPAINRVLLAWAGTDPTHHLNVAQLSN